MAVTTLACAGDVMIHRPDERTMLRHVAGILRDADIAYCNQEGPICEEGERHAGKAGSTVAHHRSTIGTAAALADAGIDMVSLPNNHTLDYGVSGLHQTMRALDAAGIVYSGAGDDLPAARKAAVLTTNGLRVALLSYTSVCVPSFAATKESPGVAMVKVKTTYEVNLRLFQQPGSPIIIRTSGEPDDVAMVVEDIKAARASADIVLVAWHWGISERWGKLADYQQQLGRVAIDAGAHAVLGHHAHMLGGVEFYHGRPIFYCLGNFAFDSDHYFFRRESMIALCDLTPDGISRVRIVPLVVNDAHEPVPVSMRKEGQKVAWLLEYFSEGMNTELVYHDDSIELKPKTN